MTRSQTKVLKINLKEVLGGLYKGSLYKSWASLFNNLLWLSPIMRHTVWLLMAVILVLKAIAQYFVATGGV